MYSDITITLKSGRDVQFVGMIVDETPSTIFIETDNGWDVEINRDDVSMVVVKPL